METQEQREQEWLIKLDELRRKYRILRAESRSGRRPILNPPPPYDSIYWEAIEIMNNEDVL